MVDGRSNPEAGALRYILKWPLKNRQILLCERTGSGTPPYHFHDEAWNEVEVWVDDLQNSEVKSGVIILDEPGRLEAKGKRFVPYWDRILEAEPAIIVAAIREESKEQLEKQLV